MVYFLSVPIFIEKCVINYNCYFLMLQLNYYIYFEYIKLNFLIPTKLNKFNKIEIKKNKVF